MGFLALCNLVFSRGRNSPLVQFFGNAGSVLSFGGKLEDQQNHGGGFGVRLHSAIGTLAVAVGTNRALIFAPLHLGIFCAFGLDGHIPAVILADKVLEGHIHAAGIALVVVAVVIIADRDKPGVKQREYPLKEIAGFNAVASEPGKVLDDDAVNPVLPNHLNQLLHLGTLKIGAAVAVVNELQHFGVERFRHSCRVFVQHKALVLDTHAVIFEVLNGQPDIKGDHIFLH